LRAPGGVELNRLIAGAESKLAEAKDKGAAGVAESINTLADISAAMRPEDLRAAYIAASDAYALAGAYRFEEVCAIAATLVDMLEPFEAATDAPRAPRLLWEAFRLHVEAMRAVQKSQAGEGALARESMLRGLREVALRAKAALITG